MSRHIRLVPLDFRHPTYRERAEQLGVDLTVDEMHADCLQPMRDQTQAQEAAEAEAWHAGTHPEYNGRWTWEQWAGGATDPRHLRPEWPEGAVMGIQLYETVSDGTPLPGCPIFANTKEGFAELCEWAAANCSTFGPMNSGFNASAEGWAAMLRPDGLGVETVVHGTPQMCLIVI